MAATGAGIALVQAREMGVSQLWISNVVAAPGDLIGYQRRAEEIAHRLRMQFDLCD